MGTQNLHKNGSFSVFIFKWNHWNAITINNSHTRFSVSSKCISCLWIFQLKFSHSKYMLRSDYWSHLIRLFWEIGSNSSVDQTANIKCHQPKNEIVFSCSQMSQSARQATKKNGILMSFIWKLFCCVAFGWNLLLFTIAQSEYKCNARMHLTVKTQSSIYAGNSRCWWHQPFFP